MLGKLINSEAIVEVLNRYEGSYECEVNGEKIYCLDEDIELIPPILVISYKSDGVNYCRGCRMESYSSDFRLVMFNTEEEAIEHCAQLDSQPYFDYGGSPAWQHYRVESASFKFDHDDYPPYIDESNSEWRDSRIEKRAAEIIEQKKNQEKVAAQEKAKKEADKKQAEELEAFQKLKAKFEQGK
jgi:hypothetical protein